MLHCSGERALRSSVASEYERAGVRERGVRSQHLLHTERHPYLELPIDEHPDPVAEFRRVYEVAKEEMLPPLEALPTRSRRKVDLGEEIRSTLIPED